MLRRLVRVYRNPWPDTIPDQALQEIFAHVASLRAEHVEKHHGTGFYKRDSLGLAFLNPAAPLWQPSSETLLATIAIGPEGERFVPNAVAKAVYHRDHGVAAGFGVYVDLSHSADGDFAYGYSTKVDNQIAGASAQSELQDAMEAGHAAVTLLYMLRNHREDWFENHHDRPHWFTGDDEPGARYEAMVQEVPEVGEFSSNE